MPNQHWHGDNFEFRRKSQKVFVDRATSDVVLRLHETDIVRVRPNGDVILSTGGWATHKTMLSMNDALELFGMYVDTSSGGIPQGRWQVTDSDGSIHPYVNDKQRFMTMIHAKSADDRNRAQWLAEAYEVPYTPPAARVAGAAAAPQGPRVAAAAPSSSTTAAAGGSSSSRSNGIAIPAAAGGGGGGGAGAPSGVPGVGGSWANVAKRSNPLHPASSSASGTAVRMTGPPGGAAAAAAAALPPATPAAAAPQRASGPPGFSGGAASRPAAAAAAGQPHQQQHNSAAAHVTSGPPMPVGAQLVQQMAQLGIDQHELEDDAHLCVVCMEEPRSIVLVPCGHMALCKDCCQQIIVAQQSQCPMCCQDVEYHVEVDQ